MKENMSSSLELYNYISIIETSFVVDGRYLVEEKNPVRSAIDSYGLAAKRGVALFVVPES